MSFKSNNLLVGIKYLWWEKLKGKWMCFYLILFEVILGVFKLWYDCS